MTTLTDRPNTALVVIDVQNDVVAQAHDRDAVVGRIAALVADAREQGTPVVWVQHSDDELAKGSDGWQYVPELVPADDEPVVHKNYRSSFESTDLNDVLAARGIGHVVLCGAETAFCVRHTTHAAIERGYDVTIVGDAHTGNSFEWQGAALDAARVIDEMNLAYDGYELPGRRVRVTPAASALAG